MAFSWVQCLRLLVLLSFGLFAVSSPLEKRALPPSIDPFYQPPAGFESKAPGTVLRSRVVIGAELGIIPATNVITYQLLFRTTAINGSAIAGATTIFRPIMGAMTDRFVSFHTAYDASASICDPSYNYQFLSVQVDLISDVEFLFLEAYLLSGYIVSSPDYEGPDAAFGAGRLSGMVALDSMRAVANFKNTLGLTTSTPKIVGYGYSGGAIATGWAASLKSNYAPELNVLGWAQGGTPANLTGTAVYIDGTTFSGFLPASVDGLSKPSSYAAQLLPILNAIVTPYGQSKLNFANNNCILDLFNFLGMSIQSTKFQSLGNRLFYQPTIAAVLAQQVMGVNQNETPKPPVYLYHAKPDEIIPYADAATLVNRWCSYGASVDFVTFANGGHFTTEILGFVGAYKFVKSAFAGGIPAGCSSQTVLDNTLDPLALGVDLEPILVDLLNALEKLGQGDSSVIADPGVLNQTIST